MKCHRTSVKLILFIAIPAFLTVACEANNTLIVAVQTAYYDIFKEVCDGNEDCSKTLDSYMGECFDRTLASNALKANTAIKKRSLNEAHIRKMQQCFRNKTGTDYWSGKDMVDEILNRE